MEERRENVSRGGPSTSQGDRLQKPNLMGPWSGSLSLQNCEKINLCCFSGSACGILLWQSEPTNTGPICYLSRVTSNLSWMDFPFPSSSCLSWKILDHASLTEKMKLRSKEFPSSHPLPFLVPIWPSLASSCYQLVSLLSVHVHQFQQFELWWSKHVQNLSGLKQHGFISHSHYILKGHWRFLIILVTEEPCLTEG